MQVTLLIDTYLHRYQNFEFTSITDQLIVTGRCFREARLFYRKWNETLHNVLYYWDNPAITYILHSAFLLSRGRWAKLVLLLQRNITQSVIKESRGRQVMTIHHLCFAANRHVSSVNACSPDTRKNRNEKWHLAKITDAWRTHKARLREAAKASQIARCNRLPLSKYSDVISVRCTPAHIFCEIHSLYR